MEQSASPVSFRVGLYEAIRRTAHAQREAVQSDDLDRFYDLLAERERLLDKTEGVQQRLDPAERARAAAVVRDIMVVDQATEKLLMTKIESTRVELGDMARGRNALAGYAYTQQQQHADRRA